MLLAIDIGNTNIVSGLFDGDNLVKTWRQETHAAFTCDEKNIDAVIVSSVVPDKNQEITDYFDVAPIFVTHENAGVEVNTDHPHEVGADRLCNTVAMVTEYAKDGHALVGIDFGTATSFDIVSPEGAFVGGILSPGIKLSLKAFGLAGAQLPQLEIQKADKIIGKNTVDAMQSGIYWGYVSLIEGTIQRIQKELGTPVRMIATGGLASLFKDEIADLDIIDPDLTLKGLLHIHKGLQKTA